MRTSLAVQPHLYIGDVTGKPLDYGMVFFGEPNKDPEFYPINIFYDEALTIPAMQPVRSKGGFLNANGDMVEVYAAEQLYSVKVLDAQGVKVFYEPAMTKENLATSVSTQLPYPNAIVRSQDDKNAENISFDDFFSGSNSIAVQSAIDTRKTLTLQNKVYDMGNAKYLSFNADNSNMVLNGNGATLKFSDSNYVGGYRIYISGTEQSLPAISADIPFNSSQVTFIAPHGLSIGDVIAIKSEALTDYQGSTGAVRRIGELFTVSKVVSPTVIITDESAIYDYLVSDSATAAKYNTVSNLTIKDLHIIDAGLDPTGATVESQRAIHMQYTKNAAIENVTIENCSGFAITARNSINWRVSDCYLSQGQTDDILTFAQYGIAINDFSRGGRISGLTVKGFKEGISFTESGVGYGLSVDTKISDVMAYDCLRVINMHATTRYVDVDGVYTNNCMRGMNVRCANVKVRNFRMTRPQTFQSQGSVLFVLSNVVRNLDIADCSIENSFYGISTESLDTNYAPRNIKIKDCTFRAVEQPVITLDFTTGSTSEASGLVISNNSFEGCNATRLIVKGRFKKPFIVNNDFGDATIGSYGLDAVGFDRGLIINNTFGANLTPVRFVDENGMVSINNWVEGNKWERATNMVNGPSTTYVSGLKNNRVGNGYQAITTATISATNSFDIMDGIRYVVSTATTGILDRINNGSMGDVVTIRAQSGSLTINNTGNIKIASVMVLNAVAKTITIVKDADGNWYEVSRTA